MRAKRKRVRYVQVFDGMKLLPNMNLMKLRCCDCGLTHRVRMRRTPKGVVMTFWVDPRATANARRAKQYRGLKVPAHA